MENKGLDQRTAWGIVALAVLSFGLTLGVGFMLDDAFLVPRLKPDWTVANLKSDFTSTVHDDPSTYLYRPLQKIMVRLQHRLGNGHPFAYHALSLAFHAGSALLFARLLLLLGGTPWAVFFSGAFYAVHPLIVDDLLAATGGESMAIFFFLLSLVLLYQEKRASFGFGILAYIAALLAKESAVMVPAFLALLYYTGRKPRRSYARILPLILLWIPYAMLRQNAVGPVEGLSLSAGAEFLLKAFPMVALESVWRVLLPWDLESWPPLRPVSAWWPLYIVLVMGIFIWLFGRRDRRGLFCAAWYILGILPRAPAMMLGNAVFDKWLSFASWGILAALALALGRPRWKAAAVALLVFWSGLSVWNIRLRGSDEKNYLWAMRARPREFAAYRLGVIYLKTGRAPEALPHLRWVREQFPGNPEYANALALAYWHSGEKKRAEKLLEEVLRQYPRHGPSAENLHEMRARR